MMVCCFAVVGLITSVISDSFVASQRREAKAWELQNDLKRGPDVMLWRLKSLHNTQKRCKNHAKTMQERVVDLNSTMLLTS